MYITSTCALHNCIIDNVINQMKVIKSRCQVQSRFDPDIQHFKNGDCQSCHHPGHFAHSYNQC